MAWGVEISAPRKEVDEPGSQRDPVRRCSALPGPAAWSRSWRRVLAAWGAQVAGETMVPIHGARHPPPPPPPRGRRLQPDAAPARLTLSAGLARPRLTSRAGWGQGPSRDAGAEGPGRGAVWGLGRFAARPWDANLAFLGLGVGVGARAPGKRRTPAWV